jgi:hypothetical protein
LEAYARRRQEESQRLANALGERTREILPAAEFEVLVKNDSVRVTGVGIRNGSTMGILVGPVWLLPLPRDKRLQIIFEKFCSQLQAFVTNSQRGEAWPARGAKGHVIVTNSLICVWWGVGGEAEALCKLRPFSRGELGI